MSITKTMYGTPMVYFTRNISSKGLLNVFKALHWDKYRNGSTAVKISTGEPPKSNYLRPELIKDLVQLVNGTIVECNTAYDGARSDTSKHYLVAKAHGFNDIADVKIQDEDGELELPVEGGTYLKYNLVGKAFPDYDNYLVISHFKGHQMAGYGGALKNISIGLASSRGKKLLHTRNPDSNTIMGKQDEFLARMAEAAWSVSEYLDHGKNITYINVMNNLSIDCDCNGHPHRPEIPDIGILASNDPVALDSACIDLIYANRKNGATSFINRLESKKGADILDYAEKLGLGSKGYTITNIGDIF